jgi:type IV pilus assembly protein PilW
VPDCIDHVMPGTAMLVVTRVQTNTVNVASAVAAESYLQISTCANDTLPFVAATGSSKANFTLLQKDCEGTKPAPLRKIVQQLYFVSTCNDCATDSIPTLKVAELRNGAIDTTALVEGIENFQAEFGIDMDGNGSPDCYTSNPTLPPEAQVDAAICPQTTPAYDWSKSAENWGNVMAVRVHALARSTEPSGGWSDTKTYDLGLAVPAAGPFNDAYKRHAYSSVVRLNNASGQRELP